MSDTVQISSLGAVIKTAYEGQANTNAFTNAEKDKLAGIEEAATADQVAAEVEFDGDGLVFATAETVQAALEQLDAAIEAIEAGEGQFPVVDTTELVRGSDNATKRWRVEVDGFSAGATRVLTPPNRNWSPSIFGSELTEITTAAAGRTKIDAAAASHTHLEAHITDLDKYTQAEVDAAIAAATYDADAIVSGTFHDDRIAESSVRQYEDVLEPLVENIQGLGDLGHENTISDASQFTFGSGDPPDGTKAIIPESDGSLSLKTIESGGDTYVAVVDDGDYSVTAFEVGTDGADKNERRFFTEDHEHEINFPSGLSSNTYGAFTIDADFGAFITSPEGVFINGLDDRGGANPVIGIRGTVTWARQDANQIRIDGATDEITVQHADHDVAGHVIKGNVAATGTVSGVLTAEEHSGGYFRTTGNVTIPTTPGFNVTLKAGGAHTVTLSGGGTSPAMEAGDVMSILIDDQSAFDGMLVGVGDKVELD